ncbi:MAG TPA: recombination protein NinG, partial [Methanosarcina sp.]|nr:recombination protein NinG [Methanosarcina sp.]
MKPKKCKICKAEFTPRTATQMVCSWSCASDYTQQLADKRKRQDEANKRKEYREEKEKQKTRADWMREAQQAFNAYIRKRDEDLPC